ncbi:Legume lectin, alpha chain, conserved site [Sesbania bispinosa]|nr:Legume lectin, alpha chain, conserved site [Sesbania bispinosa]KAJ1385950.1 Legume lectin, alpha chain, conserved site [Sesbania bispinosa]
MATTNSKALLLPKQNAFSLLLAILTSFLLLLDKANSSDSLAFHFANFGPNIKDIIFQGDAIQSSGTLQLTKLDESGRPTIFSSGRALYSAPIHLWEKSTGRLASFFTTFTFVIKPVKDSDEGGGLTFFIAPPESNLPSGSSGKYLGLFNSDTALNTSLNQVVAVEFDTHTNDEWDPNPGTIYPHIGIDVNSIKSVTTTGWHIRDVPVGSVASVQINYDSISKTLSAGLSYPNSTAKTMDSTLSHVIDLSGVLPEWVRVGFSGTTGFAVETNNVLSWSFTSSLEGKWYTLK